MAYRRAAESNRNALFGPGNSNAHNNNPSSSSRTSKTSTITPVATSAMATTTRSRPIAATSTPIGLTGMAKAEKMKEAESYSEKARKALQKSLFSSPDHIAGAMFYNRAAECYKLCGEHRLERLHRVASADCQMAQGTYTLAAAEYCRAAELTEFSEESVEQKREECVKLYQKAADAWKEEGDRGKAGGCLIKAGFAFLIGEDGQDMEQFGGSTVRLSKMNLDAMKAIEAAVESHVPDPLNRYRNFRVTGTSDFMDPSVVSNDSFSVDEATLQLCKSHLVTSSFTHETLAKALHKFVEYGEYRSALYTAGSISAVLEADGFSTISLSRAYCSETILSLALGDVVTADKNFVEVHLQNTNYLSSRECKLAEDLIRAIKMRDIVALDTARDVKGENRAAISNLDISMRGIIAGLKISGAVKIGNLTISDVADRNVLVSNTSNPPTGNMDDLLNELKIDDEEDDDEIDLT